MNRLRYVWQWLARQRRDELRFVALLPVVALFGVLLVAQLDAPGP